MATKDTKDLDFPRVVYRGESDTLGEGRGETKRVEDAADWAQAKKDGWRLDREDPKQPHVDPVPTLTIPEQDVIVDAGSATDAATSIAKSAAEKKADKK